MGPMVISTSVVNVLRLTRIKALQPSLPKFIETIPPNGHPMTAGKIRFRRKAGGRNETDPTKARPDIFEAHLFKSSNTGGKKNSPTRLPARKPVFFEETHADPSPPKFPRRDRACDTPPHDDDIKISHTRTGLYHTSGSPSHPGAVNRRYPSALF